MEDKKRYKYEKKINIVFVTIIAFTMVMMLVFITIGHDKLRETILLCVGDSHRSTFLSNIHNRMDFIGTSVWTLTTILGAFVTLYYSSMGYKNYGLSNRKIIGYTYGAYFIPSLVGLNGLVVLGMTYMYYLNYYFNFYLLVGYSCFLQALIICLCIYATTQINAFNTILYVEKKQFLVLCSDINNLILCSDTDKIEKSAIKIYDEKNKLIYHMDKILNGDELLVEKLKIIQRILEIPFNPKVPYVLECSKILYKYQLQNFQYISAYLAENNKDTDDIYDMIYKSLHDIHGGYDLIDMYKLRCYTYYGALFNSFIPNKQLKDRWMFIMYILNEIVIDVNIKKVLIVELLMSIHFLFYTGQINFDDNNELLGLERCFSGITDCKDMLLDNQIYEEKEGLRKIVSFWLEETTENIKGQWEILYDIEADIYQEGRSIYTDYLVGCCLGGN